MELNVSQVKENNQYYVKIERSQDFDDFVWQELLKTIKQFQDTPFKEEKTFNNCRVGCFFKYFTRFTKVKRFKPISSYLYKRCRKQDSRNY